MARYPLLFGSLSSYILKAPRKALFQFSQSLKHFRPEIPRYPHSLKTECPKARNPQPIPSIPTLRPKLQSMLVLVAQYQGLVKEGDLDIQAAGSDMLRVRVRARPSGECLMESVIVHSHHHQQQQQHQQHHQHHHQAPHFLLCHHRDLIVTVSVLSMVALLIRNQLAKQ